MAEIEAPIIPQLFEEFAKETIFRHTCQILKKDSIGKFSPLGTGVLVQIKDDFYLLTAAHVATFEIHPRFYIPTKQGKIEVIGYLFVGNFVEDKIDVAYFKLEKTIVDTLKLSYSFLQENKILQNLIISNSHSYFTLGYPEKNIWYENGKVITGTSGFFLPPAKEKVYNYYNYNLDYNIIMEFSGIGKDTLNLEKRKIDTEPYGMSGCGLWVITFQMGIKGPVFDYNLIGIMTEFKKGKYLVLIGCRIEIIMEELLSYY